MSYSKNNLQEKSEVYYQKANLYEEFCAAEDARGQVFNWLLPHIENKTMLDLGCGTGKYLRLFAPHAQHICGLDAAEAQLTIARAQTRNFRNISFIHADAAENPNLGKYDIALACWMLGTISSEPKRLDILNCVRASLHPGGRIFLVENDASGMFEEIREKIPVSIAYNAWLQDVAGFRITARLATSFQFRDITHARHIIGGIWGEAVGQKVNTAEIGHNVLIFEG